MSTYGSRVLHSSPDRPLRPHQNGIRVANQVRVQDAAGPGVEVLGRSVPERDGELASPVFGPVDTGSRGGSVRLVGCFGGTRGLVRIPMGEQSFWQRPTVMLMGLQSLER